MNKKIVWGVVVLVIAIAAIFSFTGSGRVVGNENYDEFAKYLTASGAKMYGAYWCPHCNSQKDMFGDSFEYVIYVECSLPNGAGQTQTCINANIQSYPTWEFGDGSRITGARSIEELAKLSGYQLDSVVN